MRAAPALGMPVGPPLVGVLCENMVYENNHKALMINKLNNFDKVPKLLDQPLGGLDA